MLQLSSVLLVDDDATTNFINKTLLKLAGVTNQVLIAENGAEALHLLKRTCQLASAESPALIILDMNMPVMNGIQFLEIYSQLSAEQQQAIVVVVLTTSLLPRDLERVRELPVADVLDKPLTKEKLHLLLEQHFSGRPEAQPLPEENEQHRQH